MSAQQKAQSTAGTPATWMLGVDGGGSKTEAWLAHGPRSAPQLLGRGSAGPGNPQAAGVAGAGENILAAIGAAFADAGLCIQPVGAACLALAGVGRKALREEMLHWAQAADLAQRIRVVHDARAVLAGGTNSGYGIALISGTGSFAFGLTATGSSARSGGWGYLWGDEGSGYVLGAAALQAVARAWDRRGPETQLTDMVLAHFQLQQPTQLIPTIYGQDNLRGLIATLAPLVLQAADHGDSVAQRICQDASGELALLVQSVAQQLKLAPHQYDLALAGGVLTHSPLLVQLLAAALDERDCAARAVELVPQPVQGALRLALDL